MAQGLTRERTKQALREQYGSGGMFSVVLLVASLVACLLLVTQDALAGHECCPDDSSPWASQSKDQWHPNANAGWPNNNMGADLPPSSGYNPDRIDQYSNPTYRAPARPGILGSCLVLKHFVGRGGSTADSSLDSPLVLFTHSVRPASEARTYWKHIFHDDICIVDCAS